MPGKISISALRKQADYHMIDEIRMSVYDYRKLINVLAAAFDCTTFGHPDVQAEDYERLVKSLEGFMP